MPFKSQAQRRYMYKNLPEIAAQWEKETPKGTKIYDMLGISKSYRPREKKIQGPPPD
jgi:hypothetical protein